MTRTWLVALVIAGCGKSASVVDNPTNGNQIGSNMSKPGSGSKATFVKGVALTPKDKLVEWLDAQKRGREARLVRLPVVLPKVDGVYDISKAKIGAAADALELYANDATLGVGLADRASGCKGPTCAFLVEGYWRGKKAGGYELEVNKAELLPDDRLAATTSAEVEGESGN